MQFNFSKIMCDVKYLHATSPILKRVTSDVQFTWWLKAYQTQLVWIHCAEFRLVINLIGTVFR